MQVHTWPHLSLICMPDFACQSCAHLTSPVHPTHTRLQLSVLHTPDLTCLSCTQVASPVHPTCTWPHLSVLCTPDLTCPCHTHLTSPVCPAHTWPHLSTCPPRVHLASPVCPAHMGWAGTGSIFLYAFITLIFGKSRFAFILISILAFSLFSYVVSGISLISPGSFKS